MDQTRDLLFDLEGPCHIFSTVNVLDYDYLCYANDNLIYKTEATKKKKKEKLDE